MRRRGDRRWTWISGGAVALCLGCTVIAGCAPAAGPAPSAAPPLSPGATADALPRSPSPAPPAAGKVTLPVTGTFQWDESKPLAPGEPLPFRLVIRPQVSVASFKITLESKGAVAILSEAEEVTGPVSGGSAHTSAIALRVDTPGRVEIRARVVGSDGEGKVLFETSYPLYLLGLEKRVLAGVEGFTALERAELERRRAAGEVDEAAYERENRRIHGGGAQETITVTPAAPAGVSS